MKLSENFDLAEFTASDTAARKGIDNTLPRELLPAALATAEMMERIRAVLGGKAIIITSGYRSPALNTAIGSTHTSDHPKALAVDFKCPEFGSWIHVSTRMPSKIPNRVITISARGTELGIQRA